MNKYNDPRYDAIDQQVTQALGLPVGLLSAIRTKGERSNADQISSAGARSVYQVTPTTRDLVLKKYGVDAYKSPQDAAMAAGYILREGLTRNKGDQAQAVGEYIGGTNRANWGKVTQAYIGRVTGNSGGSGGGGTVAEKPSGIMGVFAKYKAGTLSTQAKQEFEQDVMTGALMLPEHAHAFVVKNTGGQTLKPSVVQKYNNGQLSAEAMQQLEQDMAAGLIKIPPKMRLIKPKPKPEEQGYLSKVGQAIGNVGRTAAQEAGSQAPLQIMEGIADVAGSGVADVVGKAASGLIGIADIVASPLTSRNLSDITQTIGGVQKALSVQPPTKTGQAIGQALGVAIAEPIQQAAEYSGNVAYDVTGSPTIAAGVQTAVQGIPEVLPLHMGGRAIKRSAQGMPEPVAPQPTAQQPQPTPQAEQPRAQPMPEPIAEPTPTAQAAEPAPQPTAQPKPEGKKQGRAYTADNKPVDFEYDVIPSSELVTSHDKSLKINPNFPSELQPRDRSRAASDAQINAIQNNLNPERLAESASVSEGAPIIGSDRVVESGNGRTIAIGRAYDTGQAAGYKQFLTENAARFGLDPQRIASIPDPVLVRRRTSEIDREQFTKAANVSNVAQMSAAERAASDASRLPDTEKLTIGDDGAVNVAGSPDFVRDFIRSIPAVERGEFLTRDGGLSQSGVRRIEAAIAHKAYNDATMMERLGEGLDDQGKRISSALLRNSGALVSLADDVKAGAAFDNTLAADLAQAANKYADIKASGSTVADYMAQGRLVDDGLSDGAREAMQVFGDNARSAKVVSEYIQGKIAEVRAKGNPSQSTLFQGKKDATVKAIKSRIAQQVESTGHSKDYAEQAGELVGAYYAATAKALGVTAQEAFDRVGLNIQSGDVRKGANAHIKIGEKQHDMVFGEDANMSSFVHEAGHHFLETHAKLAKSSLELQADMAAIMEWGGHKGRDFDKLTASQKRELHEKFAESFEEYLMTGQAPTPKLKQVFEKMKAWMLDVYQSLADFAEINPRADLSPEIRSVMDRMLGGKGEAKATAKPAKKASADLLDFKRSEPVTGGVNASMHQSRYDVLRNIGLTDDQIRGGLVTGDRKRLEWDSELAKADTEYGKKMKEQKELEAQKLREYGDKVIEDMGGTPAAEPMARGKAVMQPLEAFQNWYDGKIKAFYKAADEAATETGGIELNALDDMIRKNSEWMGIKEKNTLRKGIRAYFRDLDLIDKNNNIKPMSAKTAEKFRQWLNQQWTPQTQGLIAQIRGMVDDAVISTLDKNMYGEARSAYAKYKEIFEKPKGMAKLLDFDGVNRAVSHEKVGATLAALAETDIAQFRAIVDQLKDMPTPELQAMADKALGEIRTQIAEKITGFDPTKPNTMSAIGKAFAPYKGEKVREIFGEEGAAKLENYVAAVGILRGIDANPSGSASGIRNAASKFGGMASGAGAGAVFGGTIGAAVGALAGEKIKSAFIEAMDKRAYNKAMSPAQKETMKQTYNAVARRLESSPELKAAIEAEKSGAPVAKKAATRRALEKSKAWIDFYEKLTPEQKQAINRSSSVLWLVSSQQDKQESKK